MHGPSEVKVEMDMAAPDAERVLGKKFDVEITHPGVIFGEGPVWDTRTKHLYYTDICGGGSSKGGAGAMIYVFSASGELEEKQPAPADAPARIAFGDADLSSLYLTTDGGHLYRAKGVGRKGVRH